ncbi:DUF3817 domain-containing protein [Cryptosporangium aurantiacum]|uniref:Integral membrane protein n=1 Tax=Cryptosporangium aurantiacum TaxID=134849 RepID=A0A1M7R8X2_9ACTN|nr:DUF3817 domain-containing protein [Cryptosporangium aurantiacum]SHN42683.1 integral membrane protein [Cryptosporangium aurantiacum]
MNPSVKSALTRFRIAAYVVGVGLLVLVLVAMPLKYIGDTPELSAVVSPIHGFLYMVYLAVTLDLALRLRWSVRKIIGVMLAGTVPFLSFVIEHRVHRQVLDQLESRNEVHASA